VKKWSLIFLLWYIFVDHTPWIQEPEKKTVWILRPAWSTEQDCFEIKVKLYDRFDGDGKRYMCIDMDYHNPPKHYVSPEELTQRLRGQIMELIKQLQLNQKK